MSKKARTPIEEYDDQFAIELPGQGHPTERDRLTDLALVVAYDRVPHRLPRWRLRAIEFDREDWTRSRIRMWWAAHEVRFLADDQRDDPVPEICRAYPAPQAGLPTILLCHRNTPASPAREQLEALRLNRQPAAGGHH